MCDRWVRHIAGRTGPCSKERHGVELWAVWHSEVRIQGHVCQCVAVCDEKEVLGLGQHTRHGLVVCQLIATNNH